MDERKTAGIFVTGYKNFSYNFVAAVPFVKICCIREAFSMGLRSFGITFRMEESEDERMSQDATTSHSAIWFDNKNLIFSSVL